MIQEQTHTDYPRMLYGPRGQTRVVQDEAEEREAGSEWGRTPDASHRSPQPEQVNPPPSGQEGLITAIADAVVQRLQLVGIVPKEHPNATKLQTKGDK